MSDNAAAVLIVAIFAFLYALLVFGDDLLDIIREWRRK